MINKERAGEGGMEKIKREIANMRALTHPNIIQLYQVATTSLHATSCISIHINYPLNDTQELTVISPLNEKKILKFFIRFFVVC